MADIKISRKIILVVFVILMLITGLVLFAYFGRNKGDVLPADLIEENDPMFGSEDAYLSIIEFSDFECVFCKIAYDTTLKDFKESNYFKEGKVNLIYKQFPIQQIHPNALKAAEASLCAHEQDEFWNYHDLLYENQDALAINDLKDYSVLLNLNSEQFNDCLDNDKYRLEVDKEFNLGVALGVTGTPSFIIVNKNTGTGMAIVGASPWQDFEKVLEQLE